VRSTGTRVKPAQKQPEAAEWLRVARQVLQRQPALTLATADARGAPWATPLFFVSDPSLSLYWLSDPLSRHSLDVARRSLAAAAVYVDAKDLGQIVGLQIEGQVRVICEPAERERVVALYLRKFPLPRALKKVLERSTLYVLRPRWIRLVDNRQGFGHKQEIVLDLAGRAGGTAPGLAKRPAKRP
jgi:uncharacterized protein YhbP (UPF0306 family)